jgi:hypothetical protein
MFNGGGQMITVTHKECGGPAVETDILHDYGSLKSVEQLSIHCLTCLEEITSPEELIFGEDMLQ